MEKSEFYRDARRDLTGPLDGVRVIDATTSWAGPMCACMLADLGADVIKVEAHEGEVARRIPPALPGHEPQIGYAQATVNRNKRSLTLDLRRDEGREIFLKLAARSDIIVQNFRPGTFDKWGVGYDHVRAVKPDIIYVSISGYGPVRSDSRSRRVRSARAGDGRLHLAQRQLPTGRRSRRRRGSATTSADCMARSARSRRCAIAITPAKGQHVDVAMLDAMLFQSNGNLTLGAMGVELKRWGNEIPFSIPANIYQCRDGLVMAGVLLDTHWKVLARMAGRDDLARSRRLRDDSRPHEASRRVQCDVRGVVRDAHGRGSGRGVRQRMRSRAPRSELTRRRRDARTRSSATCCRKSRRKTASSRRSPGRRRSSRARRPDTNAARPLWERIRMKSSRNWESTPSARKRLRERWRRLASGPSRRRREFRCECDRRP